MVVLERRLCTAISLRRFPKECGGCRKIKGKVFWVPFTGTGETVCPIYRCCVIGKKQKTCGGCPQLPCSRFVNDPTVSEEENAAHLKKMLERLQGNQIPALCPQNQIPESE